MSWHNAPMVAFDTETTGTDPTQARIVSACIAHVAAGETPRVRSWLADPGVPIPVEATAVHGITDERARAEGADPAQVADEVACELVDAWRGSVPVVVMNASYDITVLNAELRRNGLASLEERLGGVEMLFVDPLVLDRALDRFRRGKKRLTDLCDVYGVTLASAHSADGDALATARVAWRIAQRFPEEVQCGLVELQILQARWHAEWAESFEVYMRANVDPATVIERRWPVAGCAKLNAGRGPSR